LTVQSFYDAGKDIGESSLKLFNDVTPLLILVFITISP